MRKVFLVNIVAILLLLWLLTQNVSQAASPSFAKEVSEWANASAKQPTEREKIALQKNEEIHSIKNAGFTQQKNNIPLYWLPRKKRGNPLLKYVENGFIDKGSVVIATENKSEWGEWESSPIVIKGNTNYTISFAMRCKSIAGFAFAEVIFDNDDRYIRFLPSNWEIISESFNTKPDSTSSTIRLVLYCRPGMAVQFDNISIYESKIEIISPEPKQVFNCATPKFRWYVPGTFDTFDLIIAKDKDLKRRVFYLSGTRKDEYTLSHPLKKGKYFFGLRARKLVALASAITPSPPLESEIIPFEIAGDQEDTAAPRIIGVQPKRCGPDTIINVFVRDEPGGSDIDPSSFQLRLDGGVLKGQYKKENGKYMSQTTPSLFPGRHDATVSFSDRAGNKTKYAWRIYSSPLEPKVTIDQYNVIYFQGKPVFLNGFYSVLPEINVFEELRSSGFNAQQRYDVLTLSLGEKFLSKCDEYGFHVIGGGADPLKLDDSKIVDLIRKGDRHKSLLAYYLHDEPGPDENTIQRMERGRELVAQNSTRSSATVICYPEYFSPLRDTCDILMCDPYPYFKWQGDPIAPLTKVSDAVRHLREACNDDKPVIAAPQCFSLGPPEQRQCTFWEQRCMTYLALASGARGILYFAYNPSLDHVAEYPGLWHGMKELGKELKAHEKVWMAPEVDTEIHSFVEKSDIICSLRKMDGDYYLLAINATDKSDDVMLNIPLLQGKTLHVIGEGRKVVMNAGGACEHFAPWEVHFYTTAREFPEVYHVKSLNQECEKLRQQFYDQRKDNIAASFNDAKVTDNSSVSSLRYNAWRAIDGVYRNCWNPDALNGQPVLTVEFARNEIIDRVVVVSNQDTVFGSSSQSLKSFRVEAKVNGGWKLIVKEPSMKKVKKAYGFSPVLTQTIRLIVEQGYGVAELEAWRKQQNE